MNYSTPEKQGISSADILEYIKALEDADLATHSVIIARHGNIVFEKYWEPFHPEFLHRMYSVTKSFVSLAIGFLEQDGLIDLDDAIVKYFPEELKNQRDKNIKNQTIRNMLMMSTAKPPKRWFDARCNDRVRFYFENDSEETRPGGTAFKYDSTGSFVLGALVERLTGKELMVYLREKLLDRIGFSKEAYMLKCPGGHSWSDSALLCKPTDLLKAAMFCMNKGKHNGKQILNEDYVTSATTKQTETAHLHSGCEGQGYGYQFWIGYDNSFFFNGMGSQFALCIPDKDIILVYNADTQDRPDAKSIILDKFFELISRRASDSALPENKNDTNALYQYSAPLKLFAAKGKKNSAAQNKINGVTYALDQNPMDISEMKLVFENDCGKLCYANAQGYKEIPFGLCKNEFSNFPQAGYSDTVGSQSGSRLYGCASSGAWVSDNELYIKVQIVDTYFGVLNMHFSFDNDTVSVRMSKVAEDFLNEYNGQANGTVK